ncbi:DUF1508 domain-containing protein [Salinadaptatus halalkaliphilus]|uniref:DUF1508 domain-containing protein n=1 Tax=Salinadaptatus halalkaliphilus TaxID=2419781 RepID=A0A4V3VLA3_9EURY|nr:HVO_2922 family protein [Salinadaptatus halalkaliphilus]THE64897.1 DUF1508 domain-containing protein [Salinadaptatus halalkaliphilus]
MTDPNRESDTSATDAAAEDDGDEREIERLLSRDAGGALLRRMADGIANGSLTLEGDESITVAVPERFELELEYETADDAAELEVELEWPIVDGEAVPAASDSGTDDEAEVVSTATDAPVSTATASKAEFELYRDAADEWRWRLVHDNGNVIADSGEGYSRKAGARQGLESVMQNAPGANVVTVED